MRPIRKSHFAKAAAASFAVVLGLTACSSAGNAGGGGTGTKSLEVFSFWTSGSESAALTKLFDTYKSQYPGVDITNGAVSGGAGSNGTQVLQSRIAGNDAPDTWQSFPGASLANYVNGGLAEDLTPIFDEMKLKDVLPKAVQDLVSTDGKPYSMITGAHRVNVLWYDKAALASLGVKVGDKMSPAEFVTALATVKSAGKTPLCLGDKDIFASVQILESELIAALGPQDMQKLDKAQIKWTDPRVATALQNYSKILGYVNPDHSALTWDQAVGQFAKGSCPFTMFPDSAYGELLKLGKKDGTDFGYVAYPGTDGTFLNVSDGFVVNAKLQDKTKAENWIRTIASKEGQLEFNRLKGSTPVRTDVDVSSLGAYQQQAAKSFRSDTILGSATFGIAVPSAVQQALYDATNQFNNNRDVTGFVNAMKAATNG